jgi:hypothetical protein
MQQLVSEKTNTWLTRSAFVLFCLTVAGMIAAGAPRPAGDDLFWIGPAIGLLKSGQLINPYTQTWLSDFGTSYFYVHGPVYFYAQAAWFRLFGLSTLSIITAHWLFYIAAVACMIIFLRRVAVPAYIGFLAGILFILSFGQEVRPEPLSCAMAFGALLLWEPRVKLRSISWFNWKAFFSVLLMGLSVLTYPMALSFIPPFLLLLHLNDDSSRSVLVRQIIKERFVPSCVAGVVLIIVLALVVHGQVTEFLHVLLMCRNLRASGLLEAFPAFWKSITEYNEWILTAPCFVLFSMMGTGAIINGFVFRQGDQKQRNLVACCFLAIVLGILLYPERARVMGEVLTLISTLSILHGSLSRRLPWILWINLVLGVVIISQLQFLLLVSFCCQQPPSPANIEFVQRQLISTQKRICVDGAVARYVFDYQLPNNAVSFLYGMGSSALNTHEMRRPFTVCLHDVSLKSPDEIWAASQMSFIFNDGSDVIRGLPAEFYLYKTVKVFGRSFNSLPERPFKLLVHK